MARPKIEINDDLKLLVATPPNATKQQLEQCDANEHVQEDCPSFQLDEQSLAKPDAICDASNEMAVVDKQEMDDVEGVEDIEQQATRQEFACNTVSKRLKST